MPHLHLNTKLQLQRLLQTWLTLNYVPKIGYIRLNKSAEKLNCLISELVTQPHCALKQIGWSTEQISAMSKAKQIVKSQVEQTLNWLDLSPQHHFVSLECDHYPALLKQISRPPLFLFVDGDIELLSQPQIAFVGSRATSIGATQTTHELVRELAHYTSAITISGLALGIDAACHQASIANQLPTIGVLGCGVDMVYPTRHKALYSQVKSTGALVSEFLLGTKAEAHHFPRRNRIISGLSLGTIVVEAKIKSGSMVTAKYAIEQNREVFAVPSYVANPNAKGCHWLIKQGAKLTENIQDVIDEIPIIAKQTKKIEKSSHESLASDPLLDNVSYSATSVDLIAKRTGMSLSDVVSQLLEYELRGLVASTAEGYIKLGA